MATGDNQPDDQWPGAELATARYVATGTLQDRPLWGSDADQSALTRARRNGERAGLSEASQWVDGDFEAVASRIPEGAGLVTTLPYGHRVPITGPGDGLVRLGRMLDGRPDLGPVCVLHPGDGLEDKTRLRWMPILKFSNRGKRVALWRCKR